MDYSTMTVEELKQGYRFDVETDAYVCHTCGERFDAGQVYPVGEHFYTAARAAAEHITAAHGGAAALLIGADTRYNTLTQNQKDLLKLLASGATDREIAKALTITEATVRRQRFNFREKAKQARLYLATYESVFETAARDTLIPIHSQAVSVDERYVITEQEREKILKSVFSSLEPLRLKTFPPKEKKKVVILAIIAKQFEEGKRYTEKEVNQIIQPIFSDYVTIRRYLISYGLMDRTPSGSAYWLTE